MYYIGNIEIFDQYRYGKDHESSDGIEFNWMVVACSILDFPEETDLIEQINYSKKIGKYHKHHILNSSYVRIEQPELRYLSHIENGDTIYKHPSYLTPQLLLIDTLPGGECVGYPKGSFWIKIFQRKWRNILLKRQQKINNLKKINNIIYREIGFCPKYKNK